MISIYKDPWSVAAARDAPLAGSPLSERPNVYASLPAMSAVASLGIPASAELIEALVRCFLPAIAAEGKKALFRICPDCLTRNPFGGTRETTEEAAGRRD